MRERVGRWFVSLMSGIADEMTSTLGLTSTSFLGQDSCPAYPEMLQTSLVLLGTSSAD